MRLLLSQQPKTSPGTRDAEQQQTNPSETFVQRVCSVLWLLCVSFHFGGFLPRPSGRPRRVAASAALMPPAGPTLASSARRGRANASHWHAATLVLAVFALQPASTESQPQVGAPWPQFGRLASKNATVLGAGAPSGLGTPLGSRALLSFGLTNNVILGSTTVAADGTLYVGDHSDSNALLGTVYAFWPNTTLRWSRYVGGVYGAPAITASNLVIVSTTTFKMVYALNAATGAVVWQFELGWWSFNSPVIGPDGTIYAAADKVYAITPTGASKWNASMAGVMLLASVSVSPDGTRIIAPNYGANVTYCFSASTGAPLWGYVGTGPFTHSSAAFSADSSRIVVGSSELPLIPGNTNHGIVRCLNAATGAVLWSFASTAAIMSTATFDSAGNAFLTGLDGFAYAFAPNGAVLWNFFTGAPIYSSPLLAADSATGVPTLFFGTTDGYLYALVASTGALSWRVFTTLPLFAPPTLGSAGQLFIGAYTGGATGVLLVYGLCPAGFFCSGATGSPLPQLCPPGHYCPAGSSAWNDKNCGRGSYCPLGSAAPSTCGMKGAIDATLGPANGPAFLSDVAACRNHCYFGAPGQLSSC